MAGPVDPRWQGRGDGVGRRPFHIALGSVVPFLDNLDYPWRRLSLCPGCLRSIGSLSRERRPAPAADEVRHQSLFLKIHRCLGRSGNGLENKVA